MVKRFEKILSQQQSILESTELNYTKLINGRLSAVEHLLEEL